jgi:HSP20 family protein
MSLLTRFNPINPIKPMVRFDPFADFDDVFRGLGVRPWTRDFEAAPELRMDVDEFDKFYQVKADIPGVVKDDIAITIDHNLITISAEIKREMPAKEGEKTLHTERSYGKAFRSFTLPQEVDDAKAQARFENGVLTLTLPKKPNGLSRRIAVN